MTTKRDREQTERMLESLCRVLYAHRDLSKCDGTNLRTDAESLRRISMTLHRWHELECGDGDDHGSWCITRGHKSKDKLAPQGYVFNHDDDGTPYLEHHHYLHGRGKDYVTYSPIPDRERGARKRLAAILKRYPGLTGYVQGDPRGCALYIIRPGDVPAGATVDSCYTRGIAVYR